VSRAGCVNVFISINMINIKQCLMSLWLMLLFYFLAGRYFSFLLDERRRQKAREHRIRERKISSLCSDKY
ncbi:hypothetical protein, partial [Escherichia coli]|uniref:hypothetical protein n=1 Tax=Escherichia coli TaxID=562 RepID=UPI003896CC3F